MRRELILPGVLVALAVGIVVNFILLLPALHRMADQAHDGRLARARQCAIFPTQVKLYRDGELRGVLSPRELAAFVAHRPICR